MRQGRAASAASGRRRVSKEGGVSPGVAGSSFPFAKSFIVPPGVTSARGGAARRGGSFPTD